MSCTTVTDCDGNEIIITEQAQPEIIEIEGGCGGGGGGQGGDILNGNILAGQTIVIDAHSAELFLGALYLCSVYNTTQNKFMGFHLAVNKSGTSVFDSLYNKQGDALDIEVQNSLNGTTIEMTIKNNEGFNLSYKILRLTI